MSVKDVIKQSVYNGFAGGTNINFSKVLLILVFSIAVGIYIFFLYKVMSKSAFYSRDFNISLAGMPVIVAAIMIAMQSNILVSLGMVGALSIVRYRTAVKSSLDLLYLFWGISSGIICGVGLYVLAIALGVSVTLLILLLEFVPNLSSPQILVIRYGCLDTTNKVENVFREQKVKYKEKARNISNNGGEVIYNVVVSNKEALLSQLQGIDDISTLNLLDHYGESRV